MRVQQFSKRIGLVGIALLFILASMMIYLFLGNETPDIFLNLVTVVLVFIFIWGFVSFSVIIISSAKLRIAKLEGVESNSPLPALMLKNYKIGLTLNLSYVIICLLIFGWIFKMFLTLLSAF